MSDKKEELKRYRVLCWGACIPDYPCGLEYQGKRYETGSVIAMPPSLAKRHVKKGRLEETDLKQARGGVPLGEVYATYEAMEDEGDEVDTTLSDSLVEGANLAGTAALELGTAIVEMAEASKPKDGDK